MTEKQSRMGYRMVKNQASNKDFCFFRRNSNKICAADGITTQNATNQDNNLFRRKQTKNKVARNIFRGMEVRTKVRLMF